MLNQLQVTIQGRLTNDPEMRFTPNQRAVATFTVAHNRSKFNQQTKQWEDTGTDFVQCEAWGKLAENITDALRKGDAVVLVGDLMQKSYENKQGERRSYFSVNVQDAGASLKFPPRRESGNYAPNPWASTAQDDPAPF